MWLFLVAAFVPALVRTTSAGGLLRPRCTLVRSGLPVLMDVRPAPVADTKQDEYAVELLRRTLEQWALEDFRPVYAMLWKPNGDAFEIVADFVTEERKAILRAQRGDDETFCRASRSRGITLALDGDGPVATTFREQKPTIVRETGNPLGMGDYIAEFDIGDMKRSSLAREFGIQAIRFEPITGGVLEIGRAATAQELLLSKMAEWNDKAFKPAYAMLWQLEGDKFKIVADFVTEERKAALREQRGDDETFCKKSRGIILSRDGDGPVATAFREEKPTIVREPGAALGGGDYIAEFEISQMKRKDLAREFGIQAIRFEPVKGGVLEIGRAPQLLQAEAKSFLINPAVEFFSLTASVALLILYALDPSLDVDQGGSMVNQLEDSLQTYFCFEYVARWVAAGSLRFGATPFMLIDLVNIAPFLLSRVLGLQNLEGSLAALGSLSALRILRLRKFLGREEATRLLRLVTGDRAAQVSEEQRAVARTAFSVLAIVFVSAGVQWNLERDINDNLDSYADALYFSLSTLTTVGFGDVVPISEPGRLAVCAEMVCAVTIIPFELTSLSRTFTEQEQRRKELGLDREARGRGGREDDTDAGFLEKPRDELRELRDENARLSYELAQARAREAALQDVIKSKMKD